MMAQTNKLKDSLSHVPLIPLKNAIAVLSAFVPVMRYQVVFYYLINTYKNQQVYLAIPLGDIKGLMILKNVLSSRFMLYYSNYQTYLLILIEDEVLMTV